MENYQKLEKIGEGTVYLFLFLFLFSAANDVVSMLYTTSLITCSMI